MRIPFNEFGPTQLGLTNDPLILDTMNKASKGYAIKAGTGVIIGCVVFLAAIAAAAAWCILTT